MIKIRVIFILCSLLYNPTTLAQKIVTDPPTSPTPPTEQVDFVYIYETRCPYCIEFLQHQLYPSYLAGIDTYVNLTLLPYTNPDPLDNSVSCQHGDNECYISKAQVCALQNTKASKTAMDFIYCSEENVFNGKDVTDDDIENCVNKYKLNIGWYKVYSCIYGKQSFTLLNEKFNQALEYNLTYVPYLIFNGHHDTKTEDNARKNFYATICSLLTDDDERNKCEKGLNY